MASETPTLFNVSEATRVKLPLLMLFSLLTLTATATVAWTSVRNDVKTEASRNDAQEVRLVKAEDALASLALVKNDVAWMRSEMERRRKE